MPTRPATDSALDRLEAALPSLLKEYPDEGKFWSAFTPDADAIVRVADPADVAHAKGRIDCMLKNAGLIPGEDEGEPCF